MLTIKGAVLPRVCLCLYMRIGMLRSVKSTTKSRMQENISYMRPSSANRVKSCEKIGINSALKRANALKTKRAKNR